GPRAGRAGVDRYDLGVSMVAAQEAGMRLAGQIPIRRVAAAAGQEAKILAPPAAAGTRVHGPTLFFSITLAAISSAGPRVSSSSAVAVSRTLWLRPAWPVGCSGIFSRPLRRLPRRNGSGRAAAPPHTHRLRPPALFRRNWPQ